MLSTVHSLIELRTHPEILWYGWQPNSGVSRYDVLNGFILSQEFFNLCAVYSHTSVPVVEIPRTD